MSVLDTAVQRVTEVVASFKLLPRTYRDYRVRLARLQNMATVKASPSMSDRLRTMQQSVQDAEVQWATANGVVDQALAAIETAKRSGMIDSSLLSHATGASSQMARAFTNKRVVDEGIRSLERDAGISSSSALSMAGGGGLVKFGLLAGGALLALRMLR